MKILFAMLVSAAWVVGIYEGDCLLAVGLSIIPILLGIAYVMEIVIAAITWQIHKRRTSLGRSERQDA